MLVSVCGLALRDADLLSPVFAQALRKQVCVHLFGAEMDTVISDHNLVLADFGFDVPESQTIKRAVWRYDKAD